MVINGWLINCETVWFDDLRFLSLFSIFYNYRETLLLTNYLNTSWETRYILDMWHRSRFVFFSPGFLFARLDPRDGDLGKGKSHRSTISLSCTHMDACDYQRLTISAWPLNGYLLEMKVTRFECQESIGDSISLPPLPSFFPLSFPEHDPS